MPSLWNRITTGNSQATAQEAAEQMKSSSGNQETSQPHRSASNQPDHASVQAAALGNTVKEGLKQERTGSSRKLSTASRSVKNAHSSTSVGDTSGQARVGIPQAPASTQATGAVTTARSSGSVTTPAATGKASGEMGRGNQAPTQSNRSRSNQLDHANVQTATPQNPVKDQLNQRGGRGGPTINNSGQWPVGTSLPAPTSVQATGVNTTTRSPGRVAAPAATEKASSVEMGTANSGSTQSNPSRLNQPDRANAQVAALENPVKDQLNQGGGRADPTPNNSGQGPVRTTLPAPTTGVNTATRPPGGVVAPAATEKGSSGGMGKGNQGSSQSNRSRPNQPDHPSARAAAFENPVKDQLNQGADRVGPHKLSSERPKAVDPSTSVGDTTGQVRGNPQSSASVATGAETAARALGSVATPAATGKASSAEISKGNQGPTQSNRSRSNQPGVLENQVKDQLNQGAERLGLPNKLSSDQSKTVNSSTPIGDSSGRGPVGTHLPHPASARATSVETTTQSQESLTAPVATRRASPGEIGKGDQGSTQHNRSQSNQLDHASAKAGALQNQAKDHLNQGGERVGSSNEPRLKQLKTVDSSTPIGNTPGQGPVRNPLASPATSVQATGAEKTTRPLGSVAASAVPGKASSGEMGKTEVAREMAKPTKPLNNDPRKPASSGNSAHIPPTSDPSILRVPLVKAQPANAQDEHQMAHTAPAEAQERVNARAGNTGKGRDAVASPGVVGSKEREPNSQPSAVPMRLPEHPTSRSNTQNSLPPEGVGSRERGQGDIGSAESSDDDSNDTDDDGEVSEDARVEPLHHHTFQRQQDPQANRQMSLQQRQLLEAHAMAPKSHASRLSTAVSRIGVGGSSDESRRSTGKTLDEKLADMELSLQHSTRVIVEFDHHHRNLQARADVQGEQLQSFQHQLHDLHDDNRSLRRELKAVNLLLEDAKNQTLRLQMLLSEVGGTELKGAQVPLAKPDTISTTDAVRGGGEGGAWETSGGSDILSTAAAIQKVDVLNAEIFRVASAVGRMLQKTGFEEGAHRRITQISEKAKAMLGGNMAGLLASGLLDRANRVNPLIWQVVLQVAITNWCKMTISSWKPGNSEASNSLAELYSRTREVESPTFSPSRDQRSVTWAQLQFSSDDWSHDLLDGLLSILAFAGWSIPSPSQQNLFEEQFPPIFKAVVDVRKALGEDITSIDMEVAVVDPGTIFDSASMDNGWHTSTRENTSDIVSGTTGLGLQKVIMQSSPQGLVPKGDVLYRPKIILERTVKEILVPPSNPQRKGPLGRGRDGWF